MKTKRVLTILLCLIAAGCAFNKTGEDKVRLSAVTWSALPQWTQDNHVEALEAFKKSCVEISKKKPDAVMTGAGYGGTAQDWQAVCAKVPATGGEAEARAFFETNFKPYALSGNKGREGLFTGYYEASLHGSLQKKAGYNVPLYTRPNDLIQVSLGDFKQELKGESILGRVEGQKLVPYYKRAEIERGVLNEKVPPIVWVNSAVDAFFLHIQGSGQVVMEDGSVLRVGYAAENGQAYTAIGKEMVKRGYLETGNVSMQTIRAWLESHPEQAAEVMNINASYIFFRTLDKAQPLGAQGVELTPQRSLAVDKKKFPYGMPLFLDAENPEGADKPRLQRLMIAQDTGGAIRGAVRGDFFWGAGEVATRMAGLMKSKGYAYVLLPSSIQP